MPKKLSLVGAIILGFLSLQPADTATAEVNKHISDNLTEQLQSIDEQIRRNSTRSIKEIGDALSAIQKEKNLDTANKKELDSIEVLLTILHKHIMNNFNPPLSKHEMDLIQSLSLKQTVVVAKLAAINEQDFLEFARVSLCGTERQINLSAVCESIESLLESTKEAREFLKKVD